MSNYGLDTVRDSWALAYNAHQYYNGDPELCTLSDTAYDQLSIIVADNWSDVPEVLKAMFISPEQMRSTGMGVYLNLERLKEAKRMMK